MDADKKIDTKLASCEIKAKLPKLPSFCDGKDNMDAYLKRFERFAKNAKWPAEEWATNLSTLLQGKALEVYSRLSTEDANDYDKLMHFSSVTNLWKRGSVKNLEIVNKK